MKIQYQYFKENNLLIQQFDGDWSTEDFTAYMSKVMKDNEWKNTEKVFTDCRKVNPELALENLSNLAKLRKDVIRKKYSNVFLVDKPLLTATVHLYIEELKERNDYKYCSSIARAIELLDINYNKLELKDILNNLKLNFEEISPVVASL